MCHIFSPGGLRAGQHALGERLVGAEDAGVHGAQRHHDGAGERGGIDQVRGAELLGVSDAVGQDQAAFGVGIDHLDGFAGHGDLHVAGLLRAAAGHIFGRTE